MSIAMYNKVALVTGAGSGIGRACALAFARKGARVAVADIAEVQGKQTVELIKAEGGEACFFGVDVTCAEQVEELIQGIVNHFGRLDYACNNAGVARSGPASIVEHTETEWDRIHNINGKGVWLCMKYEIPHMLKAGGGAIVNIASILGLIGGKTVSVYAASKHAVVGLTKSSALEYAAQGIRINAVCPGVIETPMLHDYRKGIADKDQMDAKKFSETIAQNPMGRLGTPQEIANAVTWLCSDEASFVVGLALAVDGGVTAQ